MPLTKKRLTHLIGAIEDIHAVVCDKNKEMDRAGDVIVSIKIEGLWYEVIRLTERCNYYAGSSPRSGLAFELVKKNGRKKPPHAGDNWNPDDYNH
jgi:hypothetical protein